MVLLLLLLAPAFGQDPTKSDVLAAMKKAATFYKEQVSTHGGYHFTYTDDLSYGRSEQSETPNRVELQREGTPRVGMAYLEAYAATRDRFYLEAARTVALTLVKGQLCSGGWDYSIEFDAEQRKKIPYRADGNCGSAEIRKAAMTTFDDNVSQANLRFLMRTDRALNFEDKAIHESALFALDSLTKAQYPIGAWPQRYNEFPDPSKFPVKKASYPETWPRKWPGENYRHHYTFNDNSIADCIDTMLEAARIYRDAKYLASAEKGGQFILLAQMPDPQPAWAQQYDLDMHPAWARVFEPPSVTGGESQGVMRMLMVLYRETGNRKYLEPIPRALAYLKSSLLPPAEKPSEIRRRVGPGPTLARFYELKTNRPLYITKGTMLNVKGFTGQTRPDGYEISYSDESVITHYGVLISGSGLAEIEAEYQKVSTEDPAKLRRPETLHGLSPWSDRQRTPRTGGAEVRKLIESMDSRGAWVQEGVIGKSDRVVNVFVAQPMVLMVNKKPIVLGENDTVELFRGAQPPRTRILRSTTFAANLETLAAYAASQR